MEPRFVRSPRATINLERGVDFQAELGHGYRQGATIERYYMCGGHVIKVWWEMMGAEVRCRILEIDGKTTNEIISSELVSIGTNLSASKQKQILCETVKKAGITAFADARELTESIYLKMTSLNELANLIK